jgi:cyanophycinase
MKDLRTARVVLALLLVSCSVPFFAQSKPYRYYRVGNLTDIAATPRAGFALMGGGTDLDEAFRWLCGHAGGGDLVVLRATNSDDYNPYIQKLCNLNSVSTIVIQSREAATDPFVAKAIRQASAVFISGGDQASYINFWMGTPVQSALNDEIARGVPVGGTSAGLAVLGEYAYSAQGDKPGDPNLDGKTAMADPFGQRVTLVRGFLNVPILKGTITDTHFAKRNRMGRLLVFLARLNEGGITVGGIGVEERAAVLLESDGTARVVGSGSAYFVKPNEKARVLKAGVQLTLHNVAVQKVAPGQAFDVATWQGNATRYTLSVDGGTISSTQTAGSVY